APPRRSVRAPGTMAASLYREPPAEGNSVHRGGWPMLLLNSLRQMVHRDTARRRGPRRPPGHHPRTRRLLLELLEDRTLPSCTVPAAPHHAAPQRVGARLTWPATAADCGTAPVYQFSVAPHAGAFRVVRDFSPANTFAWTPMQEGTYDIQVAVKDG